MKKILTYILLFIFGALIVLPRFFHLGSQPPGLHIDEVSFAADAKSIVETGKDTWGQSWPLVFKAFGEWKAPGLTYSMAFWSKITGTMDNTIARLPSAIAGLFILIMLLYTLRRINPKSPYFLHLFAVFVLAFSPWHFDMSRIFYEAFSALALISISLYFIISATIEKNLNSKYWKWGAIFAALAGYYYASIRYVVIAVIFISVLIQKGDFTFRFKKSIYLLAILFFVGIGWVGDLFSDRGLNRLNYYNQKSAFGSALEIDEKRQFCYLSLDRNQDLTKPCYYLWNKPVEKVINATKVYTTYLGTDYMFVKAESEYGFDSNYGAYLLPILPLFLVGFIIVATALTQFDKVAIILAVTSLLSIAPSALANNINMRMSLISLYISMIFIGLGIDATYNWLGKHIGKLRIIAILGYIAVLAFFIIQSLAHYFLVFTHSNDLMWTSDAGGIFGYIKSVSSQYDRIIDTELHGPIAPYFYGDISTQDVHEGEYSIPDSIGFTYLIKAGKYELRHIAVRDLACEKLSQNDNRRTLVITNPVPELSSSRKYAAMSWSGALLLHEVYDLDDIIKHEIAGNANFKVRCSPK